MTLQTEEGAPVEGTPTPNSSPTSDRDHDNGQQGRDLGSYALNAWDLGLGVIPPRENGTKAPDVSEWKEYQTKRPSREQVEAWYANGRTGIGYITGVASGNLVMFEPEGRTVAAGMYADPIVRSLQRKLGIADEL